MTYQASPTLGVSGATADGDTAVRFAAASSQYVKTPGGAGGQATIANVFSIETWVKRITLNASINGLWLSGANTAFLYIDASDKIVGGKTSIANIFTTTVSVADTTTWHHIVWTKNGATNKVYLDAVDVTPTISDQTFASGSTGPDIFAAVSGPAFFANCGLDELAIYGTALSAARVSAHFAAASQIPASPTLSKSPPPSIVGRVPGGPKQHTHPPHPTPGPKPPPVGPPPPSPVPQRRGLIEGERENR